MTKSINITLNVWRQKNAEVKGGFETYHAANISTDMSFLEMIDVVNEQLTLDGKDPIAFDHDCREGICGMCGAVVNGRAHGPEKGTTLCQLHMRHFSSGDTIVIEPWRARAFPIIKDLAVDRSAFDQIIIAGGYISVNTGGPRMPMPYRFPRKSRKKPWMRRPASDAAPALLHVPMLRPCFLPGQRFPNLPCCPREDRKRLSGPWPWFEKWMNSASATVPMKENAKQNAPRRFPSPISPA